FLYVSNRDASNTIAIFRIDPESGKLTFVKRVSTQGSGPRHFAIDPTGAWLVAANQNTNNVLVFRVDPDTGDLTPTGTNVTVPTPVCVTFVPRTE
ncbi:MAG TPA: beta-propeller fold lactonase family protein, partial [Tepidisphaeraceae bacterium]|nr:beta-propeller fold lactonase family protein [Tepidisphaeraceae bacterium]